jgi:hypothetical protein
MRLELVLFEGGKGQFCILCIYIDDRIITGNESMIRDVIDGLNKVFKVKVQETIKDLFVYHPRSNQDCGEADQGQ